MITLLDPDGREVAARLPVCAAHFARINIEATTLKDVRVELSCAEEDGKIVYWLRLESWAAMKAIIESPKLYHADEVSFFWANYTGGIPCPLGHQGIIDAASAEIAAYRWGA